MEVAEEMTTDLSKAAVSESHEMHKKSLGFYEVMNILVLT
jgi:hypothetical protein